MRAAETTPPRVGMQGDCVGGTTPREQRGVAYAGSGGASTGRGHGRPRNGRQDDAALGSGEGGGVTVAFAERVPTDKARPATGMTPPSPRAKALGP